MTPTSVHRLTRRALAALFATALAVAGAVALFTPGAAAQTAAGSPELAYVPADAAGFVHVRAADVWKSEGFTEFRKTWERAGAKALAELDRQFTPAPSSLARLTGFVVMSPEKGPQPFGLVAFSAPFDPAAVARSYLPGGRARKSGGKTIYTSPEVQDVALYFPDNKTILVGPREGITDYLANPPAKDGPLAAALKAAAGGKAVVAAANIAALPIPPGVLDGLPPDVAPLLKAKLVTVTMDMGKELTIDLKAGYGTAAAAADAEKAARSLVRLGRDELAKFKKEFEQKLFDPDVETPRKAQDLPEAIAGVFGLGALGRADDFLADPKLLTRAGNDLTVSVTVPKEFAAFSALPAIGVGLALPAVQKVREAAGRASSSNNLKQIGLAIHAFHDVHNRMPADIRDKTGKAILSWRVEILPYIEQENLYRQIKMDEPWDGPTNKEVAKTMIRTFTSPNATNTTVPGDWGVTHYRGISGKGMAFEPGQKLRIADYTDGLSNTIIVVESGDPVAWMKPEDFVIPAKGPLPKMEVPGRPGQFNALLGDGSVRWVNGGALGQDTLRKLFTRNGGEILPNW
jgi:hypothetical protein